MDERSVQRTVVLSCGGAAAEVGRMAAELLAEPGQPAAAVACLALEAGGEPMPAVHAPGERRGRPLGVRLEAGGEPMPAVRAAVETVSATDVRPALAAAGWQLDRLDELSVIVVADLRDDGADRQATAAVAAARAAARGLLGIEASALLLALAPEIDDGAARERLRRLSAGPAFDRGVVALSRVTRDGLRLSSDAALLATAAQLVQALVASPLRDAPGQTEGAGGGPPLLTMGAGVWRWPRDEVWAALAVGWARAALAAWLAGDGPDDGAPAAGWAEGQGLAPASLAAAIGRRAPVGHGGVGHGDVGHDGMGHGDVAHAVPWSTPTPPRLRRALRELLATTPVVDAPALGEAALAVVEAAGRAALAEAHALLDEQPGGGLARARGQVDSLMAEAGQLAERAAARQEAEDLRAAELAERRAALAAEIDARLAQWPADTGRPLRDWWGALWRPWRWPGLAGDYLALHRAGQAGQRLAADEAQAAHEQAVTAALLDGYAQWAWRLEEMAGRLEEIGDMLACQARGLNEAAPPSDAATALYGQLTDGAAVEAARAATAVGGLGRQLDALDEPAIAALPDIGRERLAEVGRLPATDALRRLVAPAALPAWWAGLCQSAAPLWPPDDRPAEENAPEMTFILSPDTAALSELGAPAESAVCRRLAAASPQWITIVRVTTVGG